jgi:GT2 family glycosyltransferase
MKILIAVPCMDQVPAPFAQSLALLKKPDGVECTLAMQMGSLIYTSRNNLAQQAIQMDADYVFWLDSDMVFEPDTLIRMLKTVKERNIDILSGLYFRRVKPYSPVLFDKLDIRKNICSWSEFEKIPEDVFEIGGCGFGCVLMETSVFLSVQSKHGNMFAPISNNGEDIAFCWRARDCGYTIYCDPSVICGHIGKIIVDENFYQAFHNKR